MSFFPGPFLAVAGFAAWSVFAVLPALYGSGIREAWDTNLYWMAGVPLLLVLLIAAGFASREVPWKLALWPIAGHCLGMLLVSRTGTDLGLLPLAMIFVGVPALVLFMGAAALGGILRRVLQPEG